MAVKFTFLILPQINLMDLAGPDQVILESVGFGADFEIEYCSVNTPVKSSAGLPFGKLPHFSKVKLKQGDFLIIPGCDVDYFLSEEFKKEKPLMKWLNDSYKAGVNICSICTGAFALAESGLLDNLSCTTHFKRTGQLQQLYPLTKVAENILFTESNGIFTSAGVAAGIDMTLHIVEKLKGNYFAYMAAREMVVYIRRKGSHKQQSDLLEFRNHIHAGIHKVQDWLQENLHKKANLPELAETANMSDRNFTRIFKKETGVTVNEYITVLRKEKIKELLKNPDISRMQIARRCGLKSARHVSRIIHSN